MRIDSKFFQLNQNNLRHAEEFAGSELSAWFDSLEARRQKYQEEVEAEEKAEAETERKRREAKAEVERKRKERESQELREAEIRLAPIRKSIEKAAHLISAGDKHLVGVRSNGTVLAVGSNEFGQCDVSGWRDIVAVAAGDYHTVGLKADGTVVAVGKNDSHQCYVYSSSWTNIVAVAANRAYTVGLKSDGTVVVVGGYPFLQGNMMSRILGWRNIVAIATGGDTLEPRIVGLKADASIVDVWEHKFDWTNIVAIAVGEKTVGLKANGTVSSDPKLSGWRDVVAVSAHDKYIVGLKADRTVVVNSSMDVSAWTDIVAVKVGGGVGGYIVGLKSDGTLVATGCNWHGQCNIQDWKLFTNFETLEEEQAKAKKAALETELANLKGPFTGRRRREIEAKLVEIEMELKRL